MWANLFIETKSDYFLQQILLCYKQPFSASQSLVQMGNTQVSPIWANLFIETKPDYLLHKRVVQIVRS